MLFLFLHKALRSSSAPMPTPVLQRIFDYICVGMAQPRKLQDIVRCTLHATLVHVRMLNDAVVFDLDDLDGDLGNIRPLDEWAEIQRSGRRWKVDPRLVD